MIQAGVEAHDICEAWSVEDLVRAVFLAMLRACHSPPTKLTDHERVELLKWLDTTRKAMMEAMNDAIDEIEAGAPYTAADVLYAALARAKGARDRG